MDVRTHMETIRSTAGQIPRGVADYFWDEAYRRRELEHTLLAFFRTWGYGDVIPPSFEYADTLSARAAASSNRRCAGSSTVMAACWPCAPT